MNNNHETYMRRCYELAVSAGKKGYDTFGAVLVSRDKIIAEAENTSDYEKGIFGHAEFNLVFSEYPIKAFSSCYRLKKTFPITKKY